MSSNVYSMVRRAGLLLSLPFALSANANAALMSVGTSFGPDTATFDPSTQRNWLDLNLSLFNSVTYNDLLGPALAPGGKFEGYHLASASDAGGFIVDSGILDFNGMSPQAYTKFIDFTNMIGGNAHDFSGTGCGLVVRGISSDLDAGNAVSVGFVDMRGPAQADCMTDMPTQSSNFFESGPFTLNSAFFNVPLTDSSIQPPLSLSGAWLFQDVAVGAIPIPGTLALFSLGFLALLGNAARKVPVMGKN